MNYLWYAAIALACYSFFAPLVSLAAEDVPSDVIAFVTNGMLFFASMVAIAYHGEHVGPYLTHAKAPYVYLAGVLLSVGILAYYRALASGPVSIVVPIFGMFIVTSSVVGVLFLHEQATARKVGGIALAVVAVYLTTVE